MCQPITIVSDATADPRAIRSTADSVLWATGCTHEIRKCAKDGSGNGGLPKGANCTPTLDVKGDYVYWIEWDGPFLNAVRIDGSEPTSRIVAEVRIPGAKADFARLAVDGHNAYWAMKTPPSVWYAPLDGNNVAATPLAIAPAATDGGVVAKEPAAEPLGVAVDSTYVYWSDLGTIKRRALASLGRDLPADVVVSGEVGPLDIALNAERIYWLTSGGLVRSCVKGENCAPETLASGQAGAAFLVVDDQYVYWTTYLEAGTVSRVRKFGGRQVVEVLAKNQRWPWGIALGCWTVYWTNHNSIPGTPETGQVTKVAK
jgi:hypothetical protein